MQNIVLKRIGGISCERMDGRSCSIEEDTPEER
jgi:hypothetical protein